MSKKLVTKKNAQGAQSAILSQNTPFAVQEAYKALRTNLMFMLAGNGCKRVVFTSAQASEGKTTSCMNVAATFAQTGSRTLLIDADMRKPLVHKNFQIQSSPGLSDILGGFSNEVGLYESGFENLMIMPAGTIPPNPAELLSSKMMSGLLDRLSGKFDYIFIDTPPVDVVTDAAALSQVINGVVIVTRYNISTSESIKPAINALRHAGAEILGFILNDVDIENNNYSRRNYRYYSQYGYGEQDPDKIR